MLSFLTPLWLLALPVAILPWFWPIWKRRSAKPYRFSAFFLLPDETQRRRLSFSAEDWPLKLLRSLILVGLVLILAKPFWKEVNASKELWLIDDTLSQQAPEIEARLKQYLQSRQGPPLGAEVLKLSALFPAAPLAPVHSLKGAAEFSPLSPRLSQIAGALLARAPATQSAPLLHVHLISEFQAEQYRFNALATQAIQWEFLRPDDLPLLEHLALGEIQVRPHGLFEFLLHTSLIGESGPVKDLKISITQAGKRLAEKNVEWSGQSPQKLEIILPAEFQRLEPLEVHLQTPKGTWADHTRFFQWNRAEQLWAAILTSEGDAGLYRHGLHTLKSVLQAHRVFSFGVSTSEDLQRHSPDLIFLLGDHPLRWAEALQSLPAKLFIPTRLGDWREYARQGAPEGVKDWPFPAEQWGIDWTQAPFAVQGQIERVSPALYYAKAWKLWLLATGISPAWGPLYQDIIFADQLREWWLPLLQEHSLQKLGTFEAGQSLPVPLAGISANTQWWPGHYLWNNPENGRTYQFSLNFPTSESLPALLSEEELEQMRQYFQKRTQQTGAARATPSINRWREWLLWLVLGLLALETILLLNRLLKPRLVA